MNTLLLHLEHLHTVPFTVVLGTAQHPFSNILNKIGSSGLLRCVEERDGWGGVKGEKVKVGRTGGVERDGERKWIREKGQEKERGRGGRAGGGVADKTKKKVEFVPGCIVH